MNNKYSLILAVSFCFFTVFTTQISGQVFAKDNKQEAAKLPKWTYDEDYTGQEDWGAIDGYEKCRDGFRQSPVNIGYAKTSDLPALKFEYKPAMATVSFDKQSLITKVSDGGKLVISGKSFLLQQIEIHSPSGHRIKEEFFPVEIHLFHKNPDGGMLAIAIFAKIDERMSVQNNALEEILKQAAENKKEFKINSLGLIPEATGYYSYNGSLPYPPCTENIEWKIMKNPIIISHEQLGKIGRIVGRNSRLPQPLYVRDVLDSGE